ncbi:uncharacterized protein EV422DRAFT_508190 [Fimicolochytrium jonesii]|uniref:uncharacterized protein n=1 Tax=Fimicolochytrium jonesii TaxID=1396493 RepID=UPI0022FED114|nr:uncharacterized protein EV422DRAFT_508190 [Fimicolochytrium jonesii]KAI8818319.1 hypothetical protein EV422DRAFT_508190 [Fimicolochytrium jonesii]
MTKTSADARDPDRKRSFEFEGFSDDEHERGRSNKRQAVGDGVRTNDEYIALSDSVATNTKMEDAREHSSPAPREMLIVTDASLSGSEVRAERERRSSRSAETKFAPLGEKEFRMRGLIRTRDAGIVIGKQGRSISGIRLQSGARVQISDSIPRASDRVLVVTGVMNSVAKAFALIAAKIVSETPNNGAPATDGSTELRLLVPTQLMGMLMGRQCENIKDIMKQSAAQIYAENGSLPNSTERVVSVYGHVDAIHLAAYHIGTALHGHREEIRNFTPYIPAPLRNSDYIGGDPRGGYPAPHSSSPHPQPGGHHHPSNQQAMHPAAGYGGYPGAPPGPPADGTYQVVQMYIPNDMVGAVIGRQGASINEIRVASGCRVKVMSNNNSVHAETLVTVEGSPEANQMALYMLYARLESERASMQIR